MYDFVDISAPLQSKCVKHPQFGAQHRIHSLTHKKDHKKMIEIIVQLFINFSHLARTFVVFVADDTIIQQIRFFIYFGRFIFSSRFLRFSRIFFNSRFFFGASFPTTVFIFLGALFLTADGSVVGLFLFLDAVDGFGWD